MTCLYEKASVVKGHHTIYKAVWMPMISEELHTKLEKDNKHDEQAVAVILDGHVAAHLPRPPYGYPACLEAGV